MLEPRIHCTLRHSSGQEAHTTGCPVCHKKYLFSSEIHETLEYDIFPYIMENNTYAILGTWNPSIVHDRDYSNTLLLSYRRVPLYADRSQRQQAQQITMAGVTPFIVGVIVSQAGYVYLSDRLVGNRNRFMIRHLGAGEDDVYHTQLQGSAAKVR